VKILGLVLLILIVLGGILFIYLHYNPLPKNNGHFNVSVSTEYNNQKVRTGLEVQNQEINTSQTYELLSLKQGEVTFRNKNLKGQDFYENDYTYNILGNRRIDIELDKPEIPKISFLSVNPLVIKLKSQNFKDPFFCLKGSVNLINIRTNETKIENPEKFNDYDSCYKIDSIKGEKIIYINYLSLSHEKDEFLKITLKDKANNTITQNLLNRKI